MSVKVTVVHDFSPRILDAIRQLRSKELLVGVPEEKNNRKPDENESSEISNAAIMFIAENGSPANNIPARPVMTIGINAAQPRVVAEFKKGAQAIMDGNEGTIEKILTRVGMIASGEIKRVINNQIGIEAPAKSTIERRLARKPTPFLGTKALIVTGQLRNSVTFVIKDK